MAAKSDFAQKLLHDLKVRKERMAASQSSIHSNSTGRDAYRNSGQIYRGSRQNKALESVGSKTVNQRTRSSVSSRSLDIKESSQQVVSYGRNGSSDYIGDLSVAFAYALQNGGKAGKLDFSSKNSSMIDFLHQIGRRSLDIGKMERTGSFNTHRSSTSHFPALSHIHIKEISKGVQNLNQILRACSNGINFDKYSIEVGKELLKGAKGLEESLRMLVNLQEASEYMVSPHRKNQNRFTLLDEDEEDEGNDAKIAEQKQLDLPRFSFDKRSRNSHGTKEAVPQRLMALTYSTGPPSLMSHTRSSSCMSDFRTLSTLSETKSCSSSVTSKSEKGRLSNVIAKLMGLEEVPEKVESQSTRKASISKKKDGMVAKSSITSTKNAEASKVEVEKRGPVTIDAKPVKQANKIQQTQISAVSLKVEKIEVSSRANGGGEIPDRRQKDQRVNLMTGALTSNKASIAVDKRQNHIGRSTQIPGNGENGQNNKREHSKHTEQERAEESNIKEVKDGLQEIVVGKRSKPQTETIHEDRLISNNHQKPQKEQGLLQHPMPSKSDQHNKTHGAEKSKQQMSTHNLHVKKQDRSQINSNLSPTRVHNAANLQKKQTYTNHRVPSKKSAAATDMMPLKELPDKQNEDLSNKRESQKDLQAKQERKTSSEQPIRQEKPLHVLPTRKKEDSRYKREATRKIDKMMSRRNVVLEKLARPSKTQRSVMQELIKRSQEKMSSLKGVEQLKSSMSKELEHSIESDSNIQPLSGEKPIQEDDQRATTSQNAGGDECQSPKLVQNPPSKDQSQNMASEVLTISNYQKDEAPDCREEVEPIYQDSSPNPLAAASAYEETVEISHVSKQEHKKDYSGSRQVVLTEYEKRLKEILIKGHSFLNTAEALFKLNIPVGILHSEDHQRQDCETKLKLDCGNELMRRKARNQELIVHPYMKISISHTKMRSLDELVKQLYRDFESLTYYGRKEGDEILDAADYLHKMLERDLHGKDKDINSVWDFGWNERMFPSVEKEDVTRDLEKYVLNGLIDEITQDLLNMIIFF